MAMKARESNAAVIAAQSRGKLTIAVRNGKAQT
jgi:hypothetical protein